MVKDALIDQLVYSPTEESASELYEECNRIAEDVIMEQQDMDSFHGGPMITTADVEVVHYKDNQICVSTETIDKNVRNVRSQAKRRCLTCKCNKQKRDFVIK